MRKIKVNGRYLSWSDGSPFFYLADTAWELFHRLNREEMDLYFKQRSRQGFNAVQAVALANYDGMAHLAAGRGTGYGYVYSPLGLPFTVNLDLFADPGKLRAARFNPRDGKTETIAVFPAMGRNTFVPPSFGKGNDWVLVLEA